MADKIYKLIFTKDDGTESEVQFTAPQGEKGKTGEDGNGIASAVLNSDYTLTLTFTDGTSYTTPSIRGATGATGANGIDGTSITITETRHDGSATVIVFSDGTTVSIPDGADGSPGLRGKDGEDGTDGTSVTVKSVSESSASGGTNVVTFSDGNTLNVKNGKDGADGEDYVLTTADKNEIADSIATGLTLGVYTDGLIYIFKDGKPIGS